jgi:CheY-like chemotaxis protein
MGKKILLADDSITIQKVIELTFSDEDFDVVTVGNGRLALERLPEVRPDIVLCDIIMPEKDGYEVCDQIKKHPAFSHVPVLLLTGAFEPFDQERAARAGYDGSLAKPFEPETLIAKVRDLLARAPQRPAPPPVVPFVRPAAVVPAPAVPPPPPPPPPLRAAPPEDEAPAFIPDEPFAAEAEPTEAPAAAAPLAPMSAEESATLLETPAPEAESTSTVMFKAADLPWNAPAPQPVTAPVAPVTPPAAAAEEFETAFQPEPEPVFEPEAFDGAEVVEEPVFDEVIEEVEFEAGAPVLADEPGSADSGATVMFGGTLPPAATAPREPSATTAAFEALEEQTFAESDFEPEPVSETEPEPEVRTVPPAPAAPPFVPAPPTRAPEPPRALTPPSMPAVRPPVPPPPPPPPAAPMPPRMANPVPPPAAAPESFADLAPPEPEPSPVPSEAASLSVPVEMVEKIAQRVVAQISEKAVREIAWEVIPDLAEALIKQEIARLKAELQKN